MMGFKTRTRYWHLVICLAILLIGCAEPPKKIAFEADYVLTEVGKSTVTMKVYSDGNRFHLKRGDGLSILYDGDLLYYWNEYSARKTPDRKSVPRCRFWARPSAYAHKYEPGEEEFLGENVRVSKGTKGTWFEYVEYWRVPGEILLRDVVYSPTNDQTIDDPEYLLVCTEFKDRITDKDIFVVPPKIKESADLSGEFTRLWRDRS